jgi:phage regulator Rha-like protein
MNELITLNPTEQFLANQNITMTLKDVADKYNVEHKNATRDFKKMVTSLSDDELDTLNFELTSYIDNSNRKQSTFTLDLKTMLWFMTKFTVHIQI